MLSITEISWVLFVALCLSFPSFCFSYRAAPSFMTEHRLKMSTSISDSKVEIPASCKTFKIVEFFSGIGGWATAFESQKNSNFNVVAAYDVNCVSNEVYMHVYGKKPCSSAIESLSLKTLEALEADIWVMSPPCQPFTRQHPATENDPRSNALMHLIKSIEKLKKPPKYLALENVIGFEESPTCVTLLDTLESTGYNFMQFDLTPSQFGVPNERPRFYLLAVLNGEFSDSDVSDSALNLGAVSVDAIADGVTVGRVDRTVRKCIPGVAPRNPIALSAYLNDSLSTSELGDLIMTEKDLEKNASWCLDIVSPMDNYTSCFTKSYSKYFKGTGSVLLISDPYLSVEISTDSQVTVDAAVSAAEESKFSGSEDKIYSGVSTNTIHVDTTIASSIYEQGKSTSEDIAASSPHAPAESKNATSADFRELPETRTFDSNWKEKLKGNKLRFFSPTELLRLFGFIPVEQPRKNLKRSNLDFENSFRSETSILVDSDLYDNKPFFPSNITNRKCYELIGNSLSVTVVSHLLEFLMKSSFKI